MTQMNLMLSSDRAPEVGAFCYLRPNKDEPDRETWSWLLKMYPVARLRAGEQPSDDLAERGRAYADMLHCKIYAMKLAEMAVGLGAEGVLTDV